MQNKSFYPQFRPLPIAISTSHLTHYPLYLRWKTCGAFTLRIQPPSSDGCNQTTTLTQNQIVQRKNNSGKEGVRCLPRHISEHTTHWPLDLSKPLRDRIPSNNILTWPQPQPSGTAPVPRSFHEQPSHRVPRHSENDGFHSFHNSQLSLSVPSDPSHDGNSTCDPSPVSPATPRSATSAGGSHLGLIPLSVLKEPGRMAVPSGYTLPRVPLSFNNEWTSTYGAGQGEVLDSDRGLSACRRSCDEDSDNDSTHLLRPW